MSNATDKISSFNVSQANKVQPTSILEVPTTQEENLSNKDVIAATAARDKSVRRQELENKKAQEKLELEQAIQTQNALKLAGHVAGKAQESIDNRVQPIKDYLSGIPTPGGIATILIVLAFFIFAVIPVDSNGNTRLKLLWLTLTGKTHLAYSGTASGATGDFSPALVKPEDLPQDIKTVSGPHGGPSNGYVPNNIDIMSLLIGEN